LSAFAAADTKKALLVIALVSTLMFWALDGYYLWLERCFISLHKLVAAKDEAAIDFNMTPSKPDPVRTWLKTCMRPHLCAFYGAIIIVDVVGIFVIRSK
jgi:hypothetical protein